VIQETSIGSVGLLARLVLTVVIRDSGVRTVVHLFNGWIKVIPSSHIHTTMNVETNSQKLKATLVLLTKGCLRGRRDRREGMLSWHVDCGRWWYQVD